MKTIIKDVEKRDDEIVIRVEYADGIKTYEKRYNFVHMVDINQNFEETIKMELKRINDLEKGFEILKLKIGTEIIEEKEIIK